MCPCKQSWKCEEPPPLNKTKRKLNKNNRLLTKKELGLGENNFYLFMS